LIKKRSKPNILLQISFANHMADEIYFSGDYATWDEALRECTGYGSENILEKVLSATLKVRKGEAIGQRDGVLLDKIPYNFPLVSALLCAATHSANSLSVLDFGGSLGSSYFNSRDFLRDVSKIAWSVVEQVNFVAAGKKHLQSAELSFYETINESVRYNRPNIVVLSGVLAYLVDPWNTLRTLLQIGAEYVFIDRTGLLDSEHDRLTKQHVPDWVYLADMPAWFLSERKLLSLLREADYLCLCDFTAIDNYAVPGSDVFFKGFIWRKYRKEV
jgi:putative methyltransferase (TIGR04325 family)